MVLTSGGTLPCIRALLDDLLQLSPHECSGAVAATPCRNRLMILSEAPDLSLTAAARHARATSFLGLPETQSEQFGSHRRAIKTSFTDPKCWFKPKYRCRKTDECGVENDCAKCGVNPWDCDSEDCAMWEGKCRARDVGEGFKMGQWYYYTGPSRPFIKSGDQLTYGTYGHLVGPGKGKDPATMTEADKSQDIDSNKKSWKLMYFPGNMRYVKVKHLSNEPPHPLMEPPSKEARIARAEALYHLKPSGSMLGMTAPCDPKGRITTASDGTFCEDNQACVTALPRDFSKYTGNFCWQWFVPECERVKCPDKPYCPPPPKCLYGEGKCPPPTCPEAPPCPKQEKCEPAYWKDMCRKNAGQPWCVPPDVLKKYTRPIEVKCSATGKDIRFKEGSPDGCWWLLKHSRMDLQRLPGKIKRPYAPARWPFVTGRAKGDKDAITIEQAEKWITGGDFSGMTVENSEFLKKKQPPPSEAKTA